VVGDDVFMHTVSACLGPNPNYLMGFKGADYLMGFKGADYSMGCKGRQEETDA
jgi:hypothetical protein